MGVFAQGSRYALTLQNALGKSLPSPLEGLAERLRRRLIQAGRCSGSYALRAPCALAVLDMSAPAGYPGEVRVRPRQVPDAARPRGPPLRSSLGLRFKTASLWSHSNARRAQVFAKRRAGRNEETAALYKRKVVDACVVSREPKPQRCAAFCNEKLVSYR